MDFKKMQTNIKDNKRQIVEQMGYVDERCEDIENKITEECGAIRTQVSTNITTLKNNINTLSMLPSSGYVDVSLTTSTAKNTKYTSPINGYFFVSIQNGSSYNLFYLANGSSASISNGVSVSPNETVLIYVPCKKGDVITYFRDGAPQNIWWARFVKGVQV